MEFVTAAVTLWLFEQAPSMGVSETVSALSDLLNSQPVTARQAAERAEAEGIDLPYGTLSGYWAGNHGRPTRGSLSKLAKVVPQLSEERLQEAAWGKPAPLGPYRPTKESVHLTEPQRRALDRLIKSIVDTEGVPHADQSRLAVASAPPGASVQAAEGEEARRMIVRMSTGPDAGQIRLLTRDEFENMPQGWFYDVLGATTPDMEDATAFALGEALAKLLDEKRQDSPRRSPSRRSSTACTRSGWPSKRKRPRARPSLSVRSAQLWS